MRETGHPNKLLQEDGIHLNQEGNKLLIENIAKYYDINVSKLELSSNIKHVSSFIGNDYRGNPHVGFVGYMSIKNAVTYTIPFFLL